VLRNLRLIFRGDGYGARQHGVQGRPQPANDFLGKRHALLLLHRIASVADAVGINPMAHLVASTVASHSDGGKTARALAGTIHPKLLWNPPERELALALKKALASMPVPVPTAPMVPVSSAPVAAANVSAGLATPNRPRPAKTAVPSAAGDLPDCSLCWQCKGGKGCEGNQKQGA
jgi:hypothetical protein